MKITQNALLVLLAGLPEDATVDIKCDNEVLVDDEKMDLLKDGWVPW